MQTLRRRPLGICEDFDAKNEVSIFLFVVVGGKNADLSFSMAKLCQFGTGVNCQFLWVIFNEDNINRGS